MRKSTKRILKGLSETVGSGALIAAGNAAMKTAHPVGIAGGVVLHIGGLCVAYKGAMDILDGIQFKTDEKVGYDEEGNEYIDVRYKEV